MSECYTSASPEIWLSHLAEQYAKCDALIERSSGRTLSYSALRSLVLSEAQDLSAIAKPVRTVWIVDDRPDHIIIPYLASLVMGKRVCVANPTSFAATFRALDSARHMGSIIYGNPGTVGEDRCWRDSTLLATKSFWALSPPGYPDLPVCTRPIAQSPPSTAEVLFFSSGTTGRSKAIVIPWAALIRNTNDIASAFAFTQERHLLILPLAHTNGQVISLLAPLARGGAIVVGGPAGIGALLRLWRDIELHKISVVDCVPTVIQSLITMRQPKPAGAHRPRLFITGGAPISQTVILRFESLCQIPLLQEYGLSEAVCVSSCERPNQRKLGSVGRPLQDTHIKLVDNEGSEVPTGTKGRITIKAPSLMARYEPEGTTASPISSDGYLITNDIGWYDEEGFLFIEGRADDTFIKGGQNIIPTEVEAFAQTFTGVAQCAVVGVPCDTYGEDLVLFYVAATTVGIDEMKLREYLREKGDRMWYPRTIVKLSKIPTTPSGKILRRALRELPHSSVFRK